jgi:hypothetical protein
VNCQHATLLIGADPFASAAELSEHLQTCPSCADFHKEMLALETNIRRALDVPPPAVSGSRVRAQVADIRDAQRAATASRPRVRAAAWRGWAVAATVVVALVGGLWALRPSDTLAHDLVAHVGGEPNSWYGTQPVDIRSLEAQLRKAGITDSNITSREVIYAQMCFFRGHFVPHLVIHTSKGPVTVIMLPDEHVKGRETFNEGGYSGVIVPAQQGSLAVLTRGGSNVEGEIAQQVWFTVGPSPAPVPPSPSH